MRAVITPDDLKKGELAEVGWHPVEIVDFVEGEAGENAKNPGSWTGTFFFKILDGPSKGITAKRLLSEVALGFGKNLYLTLGFPGSVEKGFEVSSDLFRQAIGSKLEIYIKRAKSNQGNEFNDVVDYRPLKK